jgi:hypothetical protein
MSVEALWAIRFGTFAGRQLVRKSGGVVVLETGRIFGGDTWTHVTGTYELAGNNVNIDIRTGVHFTEGGESIFGGPLRPLHFSGAGTVNANHTEITVTLVEDGHKDLPLRAILTRAAELP